VTLVGEQERRLLRELHKAEQDTMKNRIVKASVIDKFKAFIDGLADEMKVILRAEREETALAQAEQEVRRAENMIEHEQEIYSRAARTWIMTEKEKKAKKGT
jgi:ATP-dependent RNA helicase DDX27